MGQFRRSVPGAVVSSSNAQASAPSKAAGRTATAAGSVLSLWDAWLYLYTHSVKGDAAAWRRRTKIEKRYGAIAPKVKAALGDAPMSTAQEFLKYFLTR